jgi:hypothetical protein
MTDIATLQMLPVDEEQAELGLRCKFTSQTVCTAFTCDGTVVIEFVLETDE